MHAAAPLLFLVHEYIVRGKNFYQPTPDVELTGSWQDWMVDQGVVNEKPDGSFTFNHEAPTQAPTSGPLADQPPTTQAASSSGSPNVIIMPPTPDLVEEFLAFQRTIPGWKACEREAMGWEGTAEENPKKDVENIGVESAE
jgi:hypothetical protein